MKLFQQNIAPFGVTESEEAVSVITLDNGQISCQILTYGAAIPSLAVPDRDGNAVDVVLGYDTLREYETQDVKYMIPYIHHTTVVDLSCDKQGCLPGVPLVRLRGYSCRTGLNFAFFVKR